MLENNLLKTNADKCNLLVSSSDFVSIRVSEYNIELVDVRNCSVPLLKISLHLTNISLIFVEKLVEKFMHDQELLHIWTYHVHISTYLTAHGHECLFQFAVQLLSTDLDVLQSHDK